MTMRALQLRALGRLEEVSLPVPEPRVEEVLIRTAATTICTSDLNDISHNPFGTVLPKVLGHEGAGVVSAVGAEVTGFRAGERVTAHPVIPCGTCDSCRRGLQHLCDDMGHLGIDRNGTFAEYFTIPARRVRLVPEGLDLAVAALMEPVAVCFEAVRRARVASGERVLVLGDGPFGLIISHLAKQAGGRAIVVGRHEFRLQRARGALTINEKQTADVAGAISAATEGRGVDAAVLAAGSAEGVRLCLQSLRARGRLVIFSGLFEPVPLDLFRLHVKELEILGSCNDQEYLDEALAALADPGLGLAELVTHRVPFREWERAFALAARGKDEALKVAITFPEAAQ